MMLSLTNLNIIVGTVYNGSVLVYCFIVMSQYSFDLSKKSSGFRYKSCVCGISITVSFSAIAEANEFMDELLTVHLPKVLAKRAILREFSVHIPKKLFVGILPTHRDINAFFSDGEITGLAAMTRKNDCKPTRADGRFSVV